MKEINHSDRAHSALGASSSKRWFACPASIPLSEGVESKTSVYAEEGSAAHELAEAALVEAKSASAFIGENINGFEVTEEMAQAVQVYVDEVTRRAGEFSDVSIEQRFSLDWIDPELFGTNDCAIYDELGTLTILDYKHGRGVPVEAVGNSQLLYYALGAARGLELSEIRLVIVQPRCEHPDGPVREWVVGPEKLKEFEAELKTKVAKVNTARDMFGGPLNKQEFYTNYAEAGDHCKFCPAAGFCEKLKSQALEVARAEFSEPVKAEDLNPVELSEILPKLDMLESWVKSVKEHAHAEAERGVHIPNFKLVKRRAHRKYISENMVAEEFEDVYGESIYTKKLKSPAQLEKIVGKEQLKEHVHTPDTGNALVPVTDKRPAITPQITDDFTEDYSDI